MAEQRLIPIFIFVTTFMVTYIIIVTMIPQQLLQASINYKKPNLPTEFSALDMTQLAWYDNHTITTENRYNSLSKVWTNPMKFFLPQGSGAQIEVWGAFVHYPDPILPTETPNLILNHIWISWYFLQGHAITEMNSNQEIITKETILSAWDESKNCSVLQGTCPCGTVYFIYVSYNQTKYSSLGNALSNREVLVLIGVGIKDAVAKVNAWNLIGQLILFQLPGIPEPYNYIIAFPFYACIGVMIYILILLAIPFVGG